MFVGVFIPIAVAVIAAGPLYLRQRDNTRKIRAHLRDVPAAEFLALVKEVDMLKATSDLDRATVNAKLDKLIEISAATAVTVGVDVKSLTTRVNALERVNATERGFGVV